MKRRTCYFLLCCGIACLTPAGLAGVLNTNSNGADGLDKPRAAASQAAPAPGDAAPAAAPSQPAAADTNSSQPVAVDTNSSRPVAAGTNSGQAVAADTNSSQPVAANEPAPDGDFEIALEVARKERTNRLYVVAAQLLESILKTNAPPEMQRLALFELGLVMEENEQLAKAQQIWSQYVHSYPSDPTVPEVLLRQGLLYRKIGADAFAVAKFYAVMSSALKLKQENLAYYKKLVVRAQTEIADTYYLDAKFDEAADFFNRILKSGDGEANREQLEWKLIRSFSYLTNQVETIGKAQSFLTRFPKSSNVPEVRFLLAAALKQTGRNADALQQVLLLLQSQQENVGKDPESWAYWQRRAGNEIANQLYREGDFADALGVYLSLGELDKTPGWQAPVWYQAGLVYEQMQQWQKATETYTRIVDRQKELNASNSTPALASLLEMAKWRLDYIAWLQKAKMNNLALLSLPSTNLPALGGH